jgi:chorismate mutase
MKLNEISRKIDKIDRELLVLLQERMGLSLRSTKFQETTGERASEADMLERMERMNLDLIKASF